MVQTRGLCGEHRPESNDTSVMHTVANILIGLAALIFLLPLQLMVLEAGLRRTESGALLSIPRSTSCSSDIHLRFILDVFNNFTDERKT